MLFAGKFIQYFNVKINISLKIIVLCSFFYNNKHVSHTFSRAFDILQIGIRYFSVLHSVGLENTFVFLIFRWMNVVSFTDFCFNLICLFCVKYYSKDSHNFVWVYMSPLGSILYLNYFFFILFYVSLYCISQHFTLVKHIFYIKKYIYLPRMVWKIVYQGNLNHRFFLHMYSKLVVQEFI